MKLLRSILGLAAMVVGSWGFASWRDAWEGKAPGEERTVAGIKLCWCPPGKFMMGSPPGEPERRPGETQVEVNLTRGFWTGNMRSRRGNGSASLANCLES